MEIVFFDVYFGTEEKYNLIRMAIYSYAKTYKIEIAEFQPDDEIKKNKYMGAAEYINNMGNNKFWAGDIEINLASYIFGIKIILYCEKKIMKKKKILLIMMNMNI